MTPAQHDRQKAQYQHWRRLTRLFRGTAPNLVIWDGIITRVQWTRIDAVKVCEN